MHSYELKRKSQPWQQCDRDEALTILAHYGKEAETMLTRIDDGETISGATFQLRKFDPGETPIKRPELQVEPDGEVLYYKTTR